MATYGANVFFGLDSQSSQNTLQDGELTVAKNVNFDIHGAVRAERTDTLISGAAALISGIGKATINGVVYYFYKAFVALDSSYRVFSFTGDEVAAQIPGTWAAGQMRVYQGDNAAVITDGTNVRVWDGEVLRKLGPLTPGSGFGAEVGVVVEALETAEGNVYQHISRLEWNWDDANASPGELYIKQRQESAVSSPRVIAEDQLFVFDLMEWSFLDKDGDTSATVRQYFSDLNGATLKASLLYPDDSTPIADDEWFRATHIVVGETETAIEVPGTGGELFRTGFGGDRERSIGGYTPLDEEFGPSSCLLTGTYKYGVVYVVEMPDGREIESKFIQIPGVVDAIEGEGTGETQDSFVLSPAYIVSVTVPKLTQTDFDDYFLDVDDLTLGTDLTYAIRVYRTKMDGESYYLLREYEHAEAYDSADPDDPQLPSALTFYDQTSDADLGALYLYGMGTREEPPVFRDAAVSANRLYAIDEGDRRIMHFSFLGDMDYWNPLANVQFPEQLTGVSAIPGFVIAFSATRCWAYDNDDGIGYMVQIPVQVGVDSQDALVSFMGNVYAANDVGLWEVSGSQVRLISLPVEDEWRSAGTGTWAGGVVGSKMLWTPKSGAAFVVKISEDGIRWARTDHPEDNNYQAFVGDPARNRMLCQAESGAYFFGTGAEYKQMEIASKQFGSGLVGVGRKLVVDVSEDIDGWLWVSSNWHGDPEPVRIVATKARRHVQVFQLKPAQGEFWVLKYSGVGALYGWHVEVVERDSAY